MDVTLSQALSLISFAFLLFATARLGPLRPTYFLGFLFFFIFQYGPHTTLLPHFFEINDTAGINSTSHVQYIILISASYLLISILILLTPARILHCRNPQDKPTHSSTILEYRFFGLAIILIATSISLPQATTIIRENLLYFIGQSNYSYTEIRRELPQGAAWSSFANTVRFAIIPLITGAIFLIALRTRNKIKKASFLAISALLPLLTAIQLNKLFYAYYLLLFAYIYLCLKRGIPHFNLHAVSFARNLGAFIFVFCVGATVLFFLYYIQYSREIADGTSSATELARTLIYRVFFASADGLAAWVNYFTVHAEPIGLRGSGKLCELFRADCVDVPLLTAIEILSSDKTSIQTGFLGTGISSLGFLGALIYIFIAYGIVVFNNAIAFYFRSSPYFPVLSAAMFINAFFLTTVPTHTALLSGGAILTPLTASILYRRFRTKRHKRKCLCEGDESTSKILDAR